MNKSKEGVIRTSREALMCKLSATSLNDGKVYENKKQTPLMNRMYSNRVKLMHTVLKESIRCTKDNYQVLILGAGLDSSYDQFGNDNCNIFCVDFPDVADIRRKSTSNSNVRFIGVDITDTNSLFQMLFSEGFIFSDYTVIVFECVLCYIEENKTIDLLSFLSSTIQSSIIISYDPIVKKSNLSCGFSLYMRDKFSSRGAPLLSSSESVSRRIDHFMSAHWTYVTCMNLNQASKCWLSSKDREVSMSVEAFDEYTSLVTVNNHYGITIATNSKVLFNQLQSNLRSTSTDSDTNRLLKVTARIAAAECQLESIEAIIRQRKERIDCVSDSCVKIRPAVESDIVSVCALYETVFKKMGDKYVSVKKFIKSNLKVLQNFNSNFNSADGSVLFVAEIERQVVGCVGGRKRDCRVELSHLCVSEAHQRKSIGTSLVNEVIKHCKALKIIDIVELTVLHDLKSARDLYFKLGFIIQRQDNLGNGCLLYYMTLDVIQ